MPFLALELPRFLTFDMDQLGKHRGHHWKKRLKISKIGNFESDTSSASEDIARQVAKFYRRLYDGGKRFVSHFWQQITFKLGNSVNLKALFP